MDSVHCISPSQFQRFSFSLLLAPLNGRPQSFVVFLDLVVLVCRASTARWGPESYMAIGSRSLVYACAQILFLFYCAFPFRLEPYGKYPHDKNTVSPSAVIEGIARCFVRKYCVHVHVSRECFFFFHFIFFFFFYCYSVQSPSLPFGMRCMYERTSPYRQTTVCCGCCYFVFGFLRTFITPFRWQSERNGAHTDDNNNNMLFTCAMCAPWTLQTVVRTIILNHLSRCLRCSLGCGCCCCYYYHYRHRTFTEHTRTVCVCGLSSIVAHLFPETGMCLHDNFSMWHRVPHASSHVPPTKSVYCRCSVAWTEGDEEIVVASNREANKMKPVKHTPMSNNTTHFTK